MADKRSDPKRQTVATLVKRCYLASRAVMDAVLRPYDVGVTQWYVLYVLAHDGPSMQRDLQRMLQVERATLSAVVAALVRKGLIEQAPDVVDQRQKRLKMTAAGTRLWRELPDLGFIGKAAFDGIGDDAIATAIRVLRTATERLENMPREGFDG